MKDNIVKRLHDFADQINSTAEERFALCNEAADEIEYLRRRCEEIDQQLRISADGIKQPFGRNWA